MRGEAQGEGVGFLSGHPHDIAGAFTGHAVDLGNGGQIGRVGGFRLAGFLGLLPELFRLKAERIVQAAQLVQLPGQGGGFGLLFIQLLPQVLGVVSGGLQFLIQGGGFHPPLGGLGFHGLIIGQRHFFHRHPAFQNDAFSIRRGEADCQGIHPSSAVTASINRRRGGVMVLSR